MLISTWQMKSPATHSMILLVLLVSVLVPSSSASAAHARRESDAVLVSKRIPGQPARGGETFFDKRFSILPEGGRLLLSREPDGTGALTVDDAMVITVTKFDGSVSEFSHDFSNGCTQLSSAGPFDLTPYTTRGVNSVRVRLMDRCGVSKGAEPIWIHNATKPKPIVFVHGFEAGSSSNADAKWKKMIGALKKWNWTGDMAPVAYYKDDRNYKASVNGHGSHGEHHGGPKEHVRDGKGLGHDANTEIHHIAYHWAWYVHDRFTSKGQAIEAVGHSMGGMITRYAIAQVQRRARDFPAKLYVEDVVTLGTPHRGTHLQKPCSVRYRQDQCERMGRRSDFVKWLHEHAANPQATGGTDWTVIGSRDDQNVTPHDSTVDMNAAHKIMYANGEDIGHSAYMTKNAGSSEETAKLSYRNKGDKGWTKDAGGPWPVRCSFFALSVKDL